MPVLLKIASIRVSFIQIMQVRVQNRGKSVWKSRYVGDVSNVSIERTLSPALPSMSVLVMRTLLMVGEQGIGMALAVAVHLS